MINLLRERIRKYFKSALFYLLLASSALMGAIMGSYNNNSADIGFFAPYAIVVLAAAVAFASARERADGIVKNKVLTGSRRRDIFVSEVASALAVVSICFFIMTVTSAVCAPSKLAPLFDERYSEWYIKLYLSCTLIFFMLTLAVGAFAAAVGMLAPRRAAAVAAAMAVFAMMLGSAYLHSRLGAEEFLITYEYDSSTPVPHPVGEGIKSPNPEYIGGVWRPICEAAEKVLPTGQFVIYNDILNPALGVWNPFFYPAYDSLGDGTFDREIAEVMQTVKIDPVSPLYSLLCIAAVTAAGALIFERRDID